MGLGPIVMRSVIQDAHAMRMEIESNLKLSL